MRVPGDTSAWHFCLGHVHCCTWGSKAHGAGPRMGCSCELWGQGFPSGLAAPQASYHTVSILGQPLQCQQRVVRLNYNIAHLILVWEH